jgi:hypothetical protein
MRDLIGVRFVDAVEGESDKARRLVLVEIGIRQEASAKNTRDYQDPHHPCIVPPAREKAFGHR